MYLFLYYKLKNIYNNNKYIYKNIYNLIRYKKILNYLFIIRYIRLKIEKMIVTFFQYSQFYRFHKFENVDNFPIEIPNFLNFPDKNATHESSKFIFISFLFYLL